MIFIGVRNDLNIIPSHPKPQTKPITVGEALKDIEPEFIKYSDNKFVKSVIRRVRPGDQLSKYHPDGNYFNYIKLSKHKPSPTITRTGFGQFFHETNRYITINEVKKLASFPDAFKFVGPPGEQWARIGNSVPPNMMKAIAENIKENVLNKI